ncbi:MAG: serine/threonine protein kinase [Halobacteriales archaeon]|nr:serine/threonine protein kinase [Halobacteriales archaeon]
MVLPESEAFRAVWAAFNLSVTAITAAVALMLLAAGPRRNWNQWLAFFLVLVSGNFLMTGLDQLALTVQLPVSIGVVHGLGAAFLALDPPVLVYFVSLFPRRTLFAEHPWGAPLLFGPGVVFLAAEVAGRGLSGGTQPFQLDPLRLAFFAYAMLCYAYAIFRLMDNLLTEPSTIMAQQTRVVTLGVLVAILPRIALAFSDAPLGALLDYVWRYADDHTFLELALRLVILAALFLAIRHRVEHRPATEARRDDARSVLRVAGSAFLAFGLLWTVGRVPVALARAGWGVPDVLAAFGLAVDQAFIFSIRWFAFSAAIIVGIVRYDVLAVDARVTRVALVAVLGTGLFVAVAAVGSAFGPWAAAAAALAFAAAAGGLAVSRAATQRRRSGAYLHERGIEVYRALLAARVANGQPVDRTEPEVERTRQQLAISGREHDTLVAIARAEDPRTTRRTDEAEGRYTIVRRLGSGGFSTVHLAFDNTTGQHVVLKRIRADLAGPRGARASSLRELEVARRVAHRNLVVVHDVVPIDDGAMVVMEFAEGGSVRERIDRERPVHPAEARRLLRDCLAGLAALHDAGIVHGDLKPENILLGAHGEAKLADFGLARATPRGRTLVQHGATLSGLGTLGYMAPELVAGGSPTPASDVYALGVVAREMLTGRPATGAGPPATGTVPAPWERFLARCLAEDPWKRFRSAEEMLGALDRLAERARPATGRLPSDRPRWSEG